MTVYLVRGSTGTHEEHHEWVSSAHASEAGAQAKIAQMRASLDIVKLQRPASKALYEAHVAYWDILRMVDPQCPCLPDADDLKWVVVAKEVKS